MNKRMFIFDCTSNLHLPTYIFTQKHFHSLKFCRFHQTCSYDVNELQSMWSCRMAPMLVLLWTPYPVLTKTNTKTCPIINIKNDFYKMYDYSAPHWIFVEQHYCVFSTFQVVFCILIQTISAVFEFWRYNKIQK